MAKNQKETFESLYQRLEESVSRLESGNLPLEESIALYEEGIVLARRCQELLDGAELRISKLKESFASEVYAAGDLPFDGDTSADEDIIDI